jgi:hypothetical protein
VTTTRFLTKVTPNTVEAYRDVLTLLPRFCRDAQSMLPIRRFYGCMIPAMASPEQESESLNSQFLVDSMPAMIHTARPDGYLDYFNKRWLEYLGVIMYDVSQWKCRAGGQGASLPRDRRKIRIRNSRPRDGWGIPLEAPLQGATPRRARQQLPLHRFSR